MSDILQRPLVGALERIETGRTGTLLRGWCLDLRSKAPPAELHIFHRGSAIGRASSYFPRKDLARLGLRESDCGFYVELAAPIDVTHLQDIELADPAGELVHLFTVPDRADVMSPLGEIESANAAEVVGWLFEPELDADNPPYIAIGDMHFPIETYMERPDLVRQGWSPRSRVGFSVNIAALYHQPKGTAARRIELWSGAQAIARTGIDGAKPLGKLESGSANGVSGWAAVAGEPDQLAFVEVLIEGQPFARLAADQKRSDLRSLGVSRQGGGFSLAWGSSPTGKASFSVSVRHLDSGIDLPGSPISIEGAASAPLRLKEVVFPDEPPTVIILDRGQRGALARCLESVARNTSTAAGLMVLGKGDGASRQIVAQYSGEASIELRPIRPGQDEASALNAAIRSVAGDVILLDATVEVGPRWIENLLIAGAQRARVGTVSALANDGGGLSAPEPNTVNALPVGWAVDDAARAVAQSARPLWPIIGVGHPLCLHIDRTCFDEVGGFEEGAGIDDVALVHAFCLNALRLGWQNVLDDRTYVVRNGPAGTGEPQMALVDYIEHGPILDSFTRRADLNTVRFRVRRSFAASAERIRPRILFVISTRSGGTPQTNRDLMRAIGALYEPYLLVSTGEIVTLYDGDDGETEIERHALERSIDPVLHGSDEYDEVVKGWLVKHAIELVHIRHLAWHSLGLPDACRALGLPLVYSFHDFYMVCPSIKLIDENLRHCGGVCTASAGPCISELWSDPRMPPLKHGYVHQWRARAMRTLDVCDAFVTTSRSAVDIIMQAFPSFADRLWIIPHGRTFERFGRAAARPAAGEPFRILVAGGLSRAKGSALVTAAARELRGEGVEFHLLGSADDGIDRDLVVMHGAYDRADFIAKASEIGAAIGLVPSLWSETYCHVLTEMWASGLPVLGYDIGAVGERIRKNGGGWLFDGLNPELLCQAIRFIRSHPEDIADRLAEVYAWQAGEGSNLTDEAMAQAYADLYERTLKGRLTIAG